MSAYRHQYLKERGKEHCLELDPDRGLEVVSGRDGCDHIHINFAVNNAIPSIRQFHQQEYERLRNSFPMFAYVNLEDPGDPENFSKNLYRMIDQSLAANRQERYRISGLKEKGDLEDLFSYRVPASRALAKLSGDTKAYSCQYAQDHLNYLSNINLATDIGIGIVGAAGALACGSAILCGAAIGIGTEAVLLLRQNQQYNNTLDSFHMGLVEAEQVGAEKDALNLTLALTPVFAAGGEVISIVGGKR